MGRKNHSLGTAFGKGKLKALAAEIDESDGRRFSDDKSATHKGLGTKPKYKKPKHKGQNYGYGY